jgi:hypothetical protein
MPFPSIPFPVSKKLLVLLALASLAAACHKDDEEPTIDFGPNNGFTMRLGNNMPGTQIDPTDWTSDPNWNATEQALFAKLNLPLAAPQLAAGTWETTAYANPSNRDNGCSFMVTPNRNSTSLPTGTTRISLVLVNAQYQVELTTDHELKANSLLLTMRLDPVKYSPPTLYRLYYVIYQPGKQVYYRGHGDVKFEQ